MIKVRYRAQLAALTGIAGEEIEAASVKDLLRGIGRRFSPETEKLAKSMLIAVNGESILHLGHYRTPLRDGDEVSFLPICGGG